MKYLILTACFLLSTHVFAQIKGNEQIVTKTFPIQNVKVIEIGLYADIMIDCKAEETLIITADENLLPLISKSVTDGKLKLDQKEWIQASKKIKIKIGASNLERIQQSTHETTRILNIDRQRFNAMAIVGRIVLNGKVDQLSASTEVGEVDAQYLTANNVNVNIWDWGKIRLGSPNTIKGIVKESGIVTYTDNGQTKVNVNTRSGGKVQNLGEQPEGPEEALSDARFIKFQVKNNSTNRIQCYVIGPKPDGSKFSYGFPMNPGQVRDKDWSIGSKVYRITRIGTRKLLTKITSSDENQVVQLYRE